LNKKISLKLSYLVFFSIVLVISSATLPGYAQDNTWIKTFNSQYFDCATSVIRTSDGNYLIAGMTDNGKKIKNIGYPFTVLKIDPSGQILWQKQIGGKEEKKSKSNLIVQNAYNQPLPGSNRPEKIIETKDNCYAVIVNSCFLKFDQMGNFLWAKDYACLYRLTSFEELEDGGFIACGTAKALIPGYSSLVVIKLDVNGNILWSKGFKVEGISSNRNSYFDIHVLKNGDFILGSRCQKDKHNCVQIICMDFQGEVKWSKIYRITDASVYNNYGFYALNLTQKDEIIFSMHCRWKGHTGEGSVITKLDSNGDIIWSKCMICPTHGYDFYIHDICCLSNDEIALSGSVTPVMISAYRNLNALVLKMQQDGSVKWIKCFGVDYKKYNCDYITKMAESDNHGLLCVGSTNSFSEPCSYDFFAIKMDSKGKVDGTSNFLREIPTENSKKILISTAEIEKEDFDFQASERECSYNEIEDCVVSQGEYIGKDIALNPPVADFKLLDPDPEWDDKVRFDASFSNDPDGTIVSYRWDFGDGKTGKGLNVFHKFNKYDGWDNRSFDVTLTVTDDQSLSSSKTMKITYGWLLSYKNKGDIGIPPALVNDTHLINYQITVITGDHDDAGTDSRVFIALYGRSPENDNRIYGSGEFQLQSSYDWFGSFEKGSKDIFDVKGYPLDEIKFITLRHTNENRNPEWYVKAVKVKNQKNQKEWLFVPDQWLGTNKLPNYQAWGKFVPVEPCQYGIFFKGRIPAKGFYRITNNIFILHNSIDSFYFTCLDKSKEMEVYKKLAQDVNIFVSPNGILIGRQEVRGEGLCDPDYLAERDFGVQYEASNLSQPTQFLVRIKGENGNWEEKTIWIFPAGWRNYQRTAKQVTLLYPLKGNNELFEYGQKAAEYLKGINIKPDFQPIINYGIASLGIFGDLPDNTFIGELENSVKRIMKKGVTEPIAVKILTKLTNEASSTIVSEAYNIITTLHKARDWARQMHSVINKSMGNVLAVDIYLNIPSKAVHFKNSNKIFSSLSEKISSLIGTIENNDVTRCKSIIEEIETMTVGSINTITETEIETSNFDYYKINYQTLGIQGEEIEGCPLFIVLMLEKNRIKGWKDGEGKREYYSQATIDMIKAQHPDNYNGYFQAGHEVALETYEPIIDNLIKIASIFINISLLD